MILKIKGANIPVHQKKEPDPSACFFWMEAEYDQVLALQSF
ncbi:hypothetical protein [Bacillus sp. FJAT-42376]|nr:hypothetical protein [Bacillus sp. FJAT-42376]